MDDYTIDELTPSVSAYELFASDSRPAVKIKKKRIPKY